ncbi:hypothetical protein CDAR_270761 [Caerostris darwini]|uniref:Uncharacterized protein n=1 Tax=Caerostris darwini TaxID=1538125 RepID=A0AAV4TDV6_9ARAC|nr:hypothetical protein CDAR_270761 [Caerostris darwini]
MKDMKFARLKGNGEGINNSTKKGKKAVELHTQDKNVNTGTFLRSSLDALSEVKGRGVFISHRGGLPKLEYLSKKRRETFRSQLSKQSPWKMQSSPGTNLRTW